MGRNFAVILVVGSLLMSLTPSSQAQRSSQCSATIQAGANRLERMFNVKIVTEYSQFRDVDNYPVQRSARNKHYSFVLSGEGIYQVISSPELMTNIAQSITQDCNDVASVSFGRYLSAEAMTIGLFPDGKLDFFQCLEDLGIDPGSQDPKINQWGWKFCDI